MRNTQLHISLIPDTPLVKSDTTHAPPFLSHHPPLQAGIPSPQTYHITTNPAAPTLPYTLCMHYNPIMPSKLQGPPPTRRHPRRSLCGRPSPQATLHTYIPPQPGERGRSAYVFHTGGKSAVLSQAVDIHDANKGQMIIICIHHSGFQASNSPFYHQGAWYSK